MLELLERPVVWLLEHAQVAEHVPDEALAVPRRGTAVHAGLEVPVQILVGVELRQVRRQVEELDLVAVGLQPGPHHFGVVDL